MACGALVAVVCGLCCVGSLRAGWGVVAVVIGGVPTLAGLVTFGFGIKIFRGKRG
jgi:hypothetical protein